ncbi:MAG: amidohydrolase family protein [Phycisphaerales bacterium]
MIPAPPKTRIQPPISNRSTIRINAPLIADATQYHAPGSIVLTAQDHRWCVHAIGRPDVIDTLDLPADTHTIQLDNQALIPALINAHTHLDLTHIGPYPHDPEGGFVPWLDMIRANRLQEDERIIDSVNLGIQKSLDGGTIAVGDIAGAPNAILKDAPIHALAQSPIIGTSFLEFFGIGKTAESAIQLVDDYLHTSMPALQDSIKNLGVTFGLSPHATNTIALSVYQWVVQVASDRDIPLCTHLAETLEEREFISKGTGTQRGFLERFGIWDESVLDQIGQGQHPITHLQSILAQHPVLCAHVNDAPAPDIHTLDVLATTNTPVVYCPRAHTYFGHFDRMGAHRYHDMLDAGIHVSLGTDSIVNLDTPDRITTLDDMRLLWNRDFQARSMPHDQLVQRLISMVTTNSAIALGLNPDALVMKPGQPTAGLIAIDMEAPAQQESIDPWSSAMMSSLPPEWIVFDPMIAQRKSD